jgi:hypothetical protein
MKLPTAFPRLHTLFRLNFALLIISSFAGTITPSLCNAAEITLAEDQFTYRTGLINDNWLSPRINVEQNGQPYQFDVGSTLTTDVSFSDSGSISMTDRSSLLDSLGDQSVAIGFKRSNGGFPINVHVKLWFTGLSGADVVDGTPTNPIDLDLTWGILVSDALEEVPLKIFNGGTVTFSGIHFELTNNSPNALMLTDVRVGVNADILILPEPSLLSLMLVGAVIASYARRRHQRSSSSNCTEEGQLIG